MAYGKPDLTSTNKQHRRRAPTVRPGLVALVALSLLLQATSLWAQAVEQQLSQRMRFKALALACVHREYPNKIAHELAGDQDVAPPRQLTPVFYGCYDWHSAVHGHWLLARLLRLYPDDPDAAEVAAALEQSFQAEAVAAEVRYIAPAQRATFERPYGAAWLLQLMAELREWDDPRARRWRETLAPLEAAYAASMSRWLQKLAYPIRIGEHAQTAFAFALFIDWAATAQDAAFLSLVKERSRQFYGGDVDCPLAYEPSGQDFLSPCLAEADLMRRVLPPTEFANWLRLFLPGIPAGGGADWLPLAEVTDRSDGKLAHLDGLHLSRAWALLGMATGLPANDPLLPAIRAAAQTQAGAGLAAVTGEFYEGGHWLASFATYLTTGRGTGNTSAMPFVASMEDTHMTMTSAKPDWPALQDFARRYTAAWCSQDPSRVAAFFSAHGTLTINGGEPSVGPQALAAAARSFMSAFPDLEVVLDELTVEDDHVVYRWTLTGTNSGPGGGGRSVRISGYEQWTFGDDGLIASSQGHFDAADYARQLHGDAGS